MQIIILLFEVHGNIKVMTYGFHMPKCLTVLSTKFGCEYLIIAQTKSQKDQNSCLYMWPLPWLGHFQLFSTKKPLIVLAKTATRHSASNRNHKNIETAFNVTFGAETEIWSPSSTFNL